MKKSPLRHPAHASVFPLLALALLGPAPLHGRTNGQWATLDDGDWAAAANWQNGIVAGGPDAVATFNTEIPRTTHVRIEAGRSVGHLLINSKQQWQFSGKLTLAVSEPDESPTITVGNGHQYITALLAGTQGFVKRGGSNLYLSGDNTYSGVTYVEAGQLYLRRGSALGASGPGNGTIIAHTAQLHLDRNSTITDDILLSRTEAGTSNSLYNDAESNTLAGLLVLERGGRSGGAYTFGIQATAGTLTLAGPISGRLAPDARPGSAATQANTLEIRTKGERSQVVIRGVASDGTLGDGGLSLVKTDPGILRLLSANTYTGVTVHKGGLLLVNNPRGSGTGSGAVTIHGGTILGGTGSIGPAGRNGVTIAAGAIVAPGDADANGAGLGSGDRLTFSLGATVGNVTFENGARLLVDLNTAAPQRQEGLAFTGLVAGQPRVIFNDNLVNFSAGGAPLRDGLHTLASFDAPDAYSGKLALGAGLEGYHATLIHDPAAIRLRIDGRVH